MRPISRALTPVQAVADHRAPPAAARWQRRWVRWADTALFDGDGQLIEIQSVGRDITEQRNSELALRASEASYRALVETQTEFVLRLSPEGRLTFVNEAYCRYVEYAARGDAQERLERFGDGRVPRIVRPTRSICGR